MTPPDAKRISIELRAREIQRNIAPALPSGTSSIVVLFNAESRSIGYASNSDDGAMLAVLKDIVRSLERSRIGRQQ